MERPRFSCISNHVSTDVFVTTSPTNEACEDVPLHLTKGRWQTWCKNPDLEHCFISLYSGKAPTARINKDNPVHELRGLIVDYDVPIDLDDVGLREEIQVPNFIHATKSGGVRTIYVFEAPVTVSCREFFDAFIREAAAALRLNSNGIPGLDKKALAAPNQYYEVGTDWNEWEQDPISSIQIDKWSFAASEKMNNAHAGRGVEVPWDIIETEMAKKYPEIPWAELSFESPNNRTTRFLDGGDATSVLLTPKGLHSFTGDEPWIGWDDSRLLGPKIVSELNGTKISKAVENIACLTGGTKFFLRGLNHGFVLATRQALSDYLSSSHGLSTRIEKGASSSELVDAFNYIVQNKSFDGAAPFIFEGKDEAHFDGKRILNLSSLKLMTPHPEADSWGVKFPRLSKYLEEVFNSENLEHFLAWAAHAVQSAYTNKPCLGLGLILMGDTNVGKNFIIEGLVGAMLGGGQDASSYITNGDQFNDVLCDRGLWMLNDPEIPEGWGKSAGMTKLLKKTLANTTLVCRGMGLSGVKLPMRARIAMSFNDDVDSLEAFPKLHESVIDKLLVLHGKRAKEFADGFPSDKQLREGELPHLLAFLLSLEIPEELASSRFGVKPFFDKSMSRRTQAVSQELDKFDILREHVFKAGCLEPETGNYVVLERAGQLFEDLEMSPGGKEAFRTPRILSRALNSFIDNQEQWSDAGLIIERKRIGAQSSRGYRIEALPIPE